MNWETSMTNEFPEAITDRFVARSYEELHRHGFRRRIRSRLPVSAAMKSPYLW
jgi:hypothetical protein